MTGKGSRLGAPSFKGYEYKKGQYVALSDADFKHANVKASETHSKSRISRMRTRFRRCISKRLLPGTRQGGQKVYSLLRKTLQATKKVAVATFVMRGRLLAPVAVKERVGKGCGRQRGRVSDGKEAGRGNVQQL